MTMGTWMLFPFATSVFFAALLHCQSLSYEYAEESSNGLFCRPICQEDDGLKGETFHCVLSNEGNDYKFIARNPEKEKWRFYRTDLDFDSSLLCQIRDNGDKFKTKKKCSGSQKVSNNIGYDFIPNSMKQILESQKSKLSGSLMPPSRKSNLAISASGPGSYAMASDGSQSLFASGNQRPSAQTSGNAHAFSSDGNTNAESHFGKDFIYPANGRPSGGRPNDESMPPFFNSFPQQPPPYPVFGNGQPPIQSGTNYPQQSFGPNSFPVFGNGQLPKQPGATYPQRIPGPNKLPFDDVFGSAQLPNPFMMLSGQLPMYSGNRNFRPGRNPPVDPLFSPNMPSDYAVAFLPYMGPYMPPYEAAPRKFRKCYPRCKREVTDSIPDDAISDEICKIAEAEVCRKKKIIYCKEGKNCCWENVDFDKCNDGQSDLSTECYMRLSSIFGLDDNL